MINCHNSHEIEKYFLRHEYLVSFKFNIDIFGQKNVGAKLELHQYYITMAVKNVMHLGKTYEGNYENILMEKDIFRQSIRTFNSYSPKLCHDQ